MHHKIDSTQTWKWGHGLRHPEDSEQMMTIQSTKAGAQGTGHENMRPRIVTCGAQDLEDTGKGELCHRKATGYGDTGEVGSGMQRIWDTGDKGTGH